ncbi:nucleoside phosphorylase [Flavobacterium sp. xlx-214]|nr:MULTISPECIES: nucleoside phosphorylase [unclassified Flavobacterium]MBA5791393.1 nucleoside phosphorylase [Flavobacterium sp. xlx-221]QMI83455.1 nucleoside phosphorylase [Flavobacterium sp. xlx-214]
MKDMKQSELILNADGSVYHLNLKPENIANDIIFVGDQDRVEEITKYFDTIEFTTQKREFKTQTGTYKGKRLTVISTGIGPDNIDIVLNELDALVNIDLATRTIKNKLISLNIIRVGTSGSLQADIPVDSFLMSTHAIGTDNMLQSYVIDYVTASDIEDAFIEHTQWHPLKGRPYAVAASDVLLNTFKNDAVFEGITITTGSFYGGQGRVLRLPVQDADMNGKLETFEFKTHRATNLEMETAAIYGLSKLLNHHAVSLSAIVANRKLGTFSKDSHQTIDKLIQFVLSKITN